MNQKNLIVGAENLILTQYPIIDSLRDEVHASVGKNSDFLVVSTLAADGYLQLIKSLRRKRYVRIYVYIPDETVSPLATVLMVLSFVVPASSRYLMTAGREIEQYYVLRGLANVASLSASVLQGAVAMLCVLVRGSYLNTVDRVTFFGRAPASNIQDFAYLRTNLWLGVQAGGALTHTWGIIGGLLRNGIKVRYLSADVRGQIGAGDFSHLPIKPNNSYVIPRELNHFSYHRTFYRSAIRHLDDFSGAIYQRVSIGNFVGVELSRRYQVPLIIEYNGSESWLSRNWGTPFVFPTLVSLTEEVSLRHAHLIATVSEPLKDELVERGIDKDRIVVHPNGVDPAIFDPSIFSQNEIDEIRQKLGIPADGVLVSFVGTFGPWHGAEKLALAAKRLIDEGADGHEGEEYFLFIGDGVRRPEVEAFTGNLIERGRVILTGLVDPSAIPSYLAASDILVSPTVRNPDKSPFFGSPTKLFEYMAAGKPVIASQIGQIEEVMAGSKTVTELASGESDNNDLSDDGIGILTAPGDIGELCTAIRFLSERREHRENWGANARQRVLSRYTWDDHVKAITSKLEKVIAEEKTTKIRVLLNGLHSKSGGGVTYLRNLIPYLCADKRLDVHICLNEKQIPLFQSWIDEVTLHKANLDDSLWRTILFEQFSLPKLARDINADVTFSPANYGPVFAPRTVILLRNALSVAFVERRLPKILYWAMLYVGTLLSVLVARNVIGVSEYARKSTVGGIFKWASDKFQTIPHGISTNFEADSSIVREKRSLLFVSDIYVQKNLHGFFKSLSLLKKKFPDIKLRVAGATVDRDYNERIKRLIDELNLQDVVEFLGNLDQVALKREYRLATVFVFPSTVETFGNPLVEAMACGAPIACSNTAAMPEVAGEAAEYFDPFDPEEMAQVVENLLNNEGRRKELSGLGSERSKMFSWEETARKTADVLIDAARN